MAFVINMYCRISDVDWFQFRSYAALRCSDSQYESPLIDSDIPPPYSNELSCTVCHDDAP